MKRHPILREDDYVDDEGAVRRPLRRRGAQLTREDVERIARRQGPDSPAAWALETAERLGGGCTFEWDGENEVWVVGTPDAPAVNTQVLIPPESIAGCCLPRSPERRERRAEMRAGMEAAASDAEYVAEMEREGRVWEGVVGDGLDDEEET